METVIQCLIQCLKDSCLSAVNLIWSNNAGRNSIKNYLIIFSATPNLQIIVDQLQSILGHDNDASKKQVAVWNELGHVPPYHSQEAAMVSWNIVSHITFIFISMLCLLRLKLSDNKKRMADEFSTKNDVNFIVICGSQLDCYWRKMKNVVLELKIKELETCDITSGYVPADNISKTNWFLHRIENKIKTKMLDWRRANSETVNLRNPPGHRNYRFQ